MNYKTFILLFIAVVGCCVRPARSIMYGSIEMTDCSDTYRTEGAEVVMCGYVPVLLNHTNPASSEKINIAVFLVPAVKANPERKVFFMPQGGPGVVGHTAIGNYADRYVNLHQEYDLLFMDQRGTGLSCRLLCPIAFTKLITTSMPTGNTDAQAADRLAKYIQASSTFRTECASEWINYAPAECIIGSTLPIGDQLEKLAALLQTNQTVEDLETIRTSLGYGKIWYYGRSYSTQIADIYGARHPEAFAALVVDGTIDLRESMYEWLPGMRIARDHVATRMGELCAADCACSHDICRDRPSTCKHMFASALTQLEALVDGMPVAFPAASGNRDEYYPVKLTRSRLEAVFQDWAIWVEDRPYLVRAIGQLLRGNAIPAIELIYSDWGLNLDGTVDPQAAIEASYANNYYVQTCGADYSYAKDPAYPITNPSAFRESGAQRTTDMIDFLRANYSLPFGSAWSTDVYEAMWNPDNLTPDAYNAQYSPQYISHSFPVIMITSLLDPQVHPAGSMGLFEDIAAAGPAPSYEILVENGQHVSYLGASSSDRGFKCVSSIVENAALLGKWPRRQTTMCNVANPFPNYIPMPPADIADSFNVGEIIHWSQTELYAAPAYWWWMYENMGCHYSGNLTYFYNDERLATEVQMSSCNYFGNFALSGTGYFFDSGRAKFVLDVATADGVRVGTYKYIMNKDRSYTYTRIRKGHTSLALMSEY